MIDLEEAYRRRGLPSIKKLWYVDLRLNNDAIPFLGIGWKAPGEWFVGAEITGMHKAFKDRTDSSIPYDYNLNLGGKQVRLAAMKEFLPFKQNKISFGAGVAAGREWTRVKYDFSNLVSGTTIDRGSDEQGVETNFVSIMSDFRYTPEHTFLETPLSWIFGVETKVWSERDSYDVNLPNGSKRPKELSPLTGTYAWIGAAFYF